MGETCCFHRVGRSRSIETNLFEHVSILACLQGGIAIGYVGYMTYLRFVIVGFVNSVED